MDPTCSDKKIADFFARFQSFQSSGASAFKPGLERMEFTDQLSGHPHRKYKCVHVAGTNGKGSVCNMLASALAATGLKVGLYTSPHLLNVRERMRVIDEGGSRLASPEALGGIIDLWGDTYLNLGLSYFEVTTALAFEWFAREGVDAAVIETGLGGRLDSTNIVNPVLSVITNIGYDHCDILGNSLGEIAYEKAGIIKALTPVVVGESNPGTDKVFERKVLYTNLPEVEFMGDRGRIMSLLHFADKEIPKGWEDAPALLASMDLQGPCQEKNLRTTLMALQLLDVALTPEVKDALACTARRTDFHGRWERLAISKNYEVIADIGHNEHGLRLNFARLSELANGAVGAAANGASRAANAGRRLIMVYGSVADKDVDAVLKILPREASLVIFTNADTPRALPADALAARYEAVCAAAGTPPRPHLVRDSVPDAVRSAIEAAETQENTLIYIGGSTYVVSEAIPCF